MKLRSRFMVGLSMALTITLSLVVIVRIAKAGTLAPSAAPSATMYTLSDIYNRLTAGTTTTEGGHTFSPAGSPASSERTLAEIYAAIPTITATSIISGVSYMGVAGSFNAALGDATAARVLTGYTFSNSTTSNISGTMADNGAVTITPSTSTQTIAAGYHNGSGTVAGDTDLAAANIATGTNIFGVIGTAVSALGDANAAQVLTGYTFSNSTTSHISGTMANNGAVTITPSTVDQTIAAGYHNGSGLVSGDADLVTSSIITNINIFGVTGTIFSNQFNGSNAAGTFPGGSQELGGIDDGNTGNGTPVNAYVGRWTACAVGNNYCGTGLTSADGRDNTTNLIWSLPCNGSGCSSLSDSSPLTYSWDASAVNNGALTALQLCASGSHGESGWALPHQKQALQAYINASYNNLLAANTGVAAQWSSTSVSANNSNAWLMNLSSGTGLSQAKTVVSNLRCVRAGS